MGTKGNKTGNTGTNAYFREQGTPAKIEEILLGNTGTQGNFCWEQGNMDPLNSPSLTDHKSQCRAKISQLRLK